MLAGTPVIEGHGDLHVGQVLHSAGRFVVTDFDGNPYCGPKSGCYRFRRRSTSRAWPSQFAHSAVVARKHTHLDAAAVAEVDALVRSRFPRRLRVAPGMQLGHAGCTTPAPLHAFRTQQALREIIYAARHLPRWMYVPDTALPALLDEGEPNVKPDGFAADLYRKPEVLQRLAAMLADENPWAEVVPPDVERVVLIGMGSSAYAGGIAAARMRARGLVASSELASSRLLPHWEAEHSSSRHRPAAARRRPWTPSGVCQKPCIRSR